MPSPLYHIVTNAVGVSSQQEFYPLYAGNGCSGRPGSPSSPPGRSSCDEEGDATVMDEDLTSSLTEIPPPASNDPKAVRSSQQSSGVSGGAAEDAPDREAANSSDSDGDTVASDQSTTPGPSTSRKADVSTKPEKIPPVTAGAIPDMPLVDVAASLGDKPTLEVLPAVSKSPVASQLSVQEDPPDMAVDSASGCSSPSASSGEASRKEGGGGSREEDSSDELGVRIYVSDGTMPDAMPVVETFCLEQDPPAWSLTNDEGIDIDDIFGSGTAGLGTDSDDCDLMAIAGLDDMDIDSLLVVPGVEDADGGCTDVLEMDEVEVNTPASTGEAPNSPTPRDLEEGSGPGIVANRSKDVTSRGCRNSRTSRSSNRKVLKALSSRPSVSKGCVAATSQRSSTGGKPRRGCGAEVMDSLSAGGGGGGGIPESDSVPSGRSAVASTVAAGVIGTLCLAGVVMNSGNAVSSGVPSNLVRLWQASAYYCP